MPSSGLGKYLVCQIRHIPSSRIAPQAICNKSSTPSLLSELGAIVKSLEHLGLVRIDRQSEKGLQRGARDHALDRDVLSRNAIDLGMLSHDLRNVSLDCLQHRRASKIGHQSMRCSRRFHDGVGCHRREGGGLSCVFQQISTCDRVRIVLAKSRRRASEHSLTIACRATRVKREQLSVPWLTAVPPIRKTRSETETNDDQQVIYAAFSRNRR